jgi:hypothetical protein
MNCRWRRRIAARDLPIRRTGATRLNSGVQQSLGALPQIAQEIPINIVVLWHYYNITIDVKQVHYLYVFTIYLVGQ